MRPLESNNRSTALRARFLGSDLLNHSCIFSQDNKITKIMNDYVKHQTNSTSEERVKLKQNFLSAKI